MRFIKENPALAAGIGLPVLLVILFSVASMIPQWTVAPPQYDVLFIDEQYDNTPESTYSFQVVDGRVKVKGLSISAETTKQHSGRQVQRLYRYRIASNTAEEIMLPPAAVENTEWQELAVPDIASLKVDSKATAPDGYIFSNRDNNRGGIFPFDNYSSRYAWALRKNTRIVPVQPPTGRNYYSANMKFLGWIISEDAPNAQ